MTMVVKEADVKIRLPRATDHERLADLCGQLGYAARVQEIERRLAEINGLPDYAVFVAELPAGEIAGFVGVFVYRCVEADPRAEINGLIVDERRRSSGIGRRLMDRAEQWAREKNCSAISLRSQTFREGAHSFYEQLGYHHVKTQKAFRKDL